MIETVPPRPRGILTESFPEECTAIVDVMLARHIKYILGSAVFEYLGERGVGCALRVGRAGGEQVDGKAGFRRAQFLPQGQG